MGNDGAVFSCTKPSTAAHAPAPSPAPSTRTTAPSATHVGLQQGARDQYTHYRTDDEEVTEGLDATVARKLAAKYDLALQDEVCAWAAGLGVVLASGSMDGFMDA